MSVIETIPPSAFRFTSGLPVLALDLSFACKRRVLAHGELDATLERALRIAPIDITFATSSADALRTLAWTTFDGVLVAPGAEDGIALVKALKLGAPVNGVDADHVRLAAVRQRVTPVFVLPLPGEEQYAVIVVAPSVAFLEREDRVPLAHAITRYDHRRLAGVKGRVPFEPGVS